MRPPIEGDGYKKLEVRMNEYRQVPGGVGVSSVPGAIKPDRTPPSPLASGSGSESARLGQPLILMDGYVVSPVFVSSCTGQ